MASSRINFLIAILIGIGLSSCTRPEDTKSKMSLSLPSKMSSHKLGSLALAAEDLLVHVAINVSGSDLPGPVVLQWDSHGGDLSTSAPPTSFFLEIPMGSDRLIQVLAVYQNATTHSMSFYYGDGVKTLASSEEQVLIPISQIGVNQSVVTGQVSGRILTAANDGPTGMVDIKFNPGNGKPSLIVDRTYIVSGWLSVFMLSGVSLDYILASTGVNLFGGPISLDSTLFNPSSQVLKIAVPVHVGEENRDGTTSKTIREPELNVWGFWSFNGTDLSSKVICNDLSANAFSRLKLYNAIPSTSTTALGYDDLGLAGYPNNEALLNTTSFLTAIKGKGGVSVVGSSTCGQYSLTSTQDNFVNFLSVNKNSIDGRGHDQMAGFRNIYRLKSGPYGGSPITITPSVSSSAVSGQVLPGVTTLFDGIKFFKRIGVSGEDFYIDKPSCPEIASGLLGFTPTGEVTSFSTEGLFSGTLNVTSADFGSGNVAIVACPSKNGTLASHGYFTNMSSGGVTGGGVADGFSARLDWSKLLFGQCHEIQIDLTSNGSFFGVTNSQGVQFNLPTITGLADGGMYSSGFYSDETCSTSLSDPFLLPANTTRKNVYFLITGSPATSGVVNISTSAFGGKSMGLPLAVNSTAGVTNFALTQEGLFLGSGECRSFAVVFTDGQGFSGDYTGALSYTVPSSIGLFTDSSCTSAVSSSPLSISANFKQIFYAKRLSGSGQSTISFTAFSSTKTLVIDPTPLVDHLSIGLPGAAYYPGDCIATTVTAKNAADAAINPSSTFGFYLSGNRVAFFSDASCAVMQGPITMPTSGVFNTYTKFTQSGVFSVSAGSMYATSSPNPITGNVAVPLSLSPSSWNFGSVAVSTSSTPQTLTLTNSGTQAVTNISGALPANFSYTGGSYPGSGGTCGTTLAGGTACMISLTFTPTAAGSSAGPLNLSYNDGTLQTQLLTLQLSGTGI